MSRWITPTSLALACTGLLAACNDPAPPASPPAVPPSVSSAPPSAPPAVLPPVELPRGADAAGTAKDSAATDPKGTLTREEESKSMPMAAHGNNHSSPSLDPAAKK
jgi:hypothetical protein